MDAIGTMKILIEADAGGLTSQLKRASSNITNFIGTMNKQEVNWTSILSRTISPAIISGIAATFALAIGETLSFQNSMSNAAMTGSQAFSDNLGTAGESVLGLSSATGIGMGKMASASAFLSHYIDANSAVFKSFSEQVGSFAYAAGLDYKNLLMETLPVMKDWGIKAVDMANGVNDIVSASQSGVITMSELPDVLLKMADGFRDTKIPLKDVAFYLEELSNIVPKDDAIKIMEAIGKAAADALDPMNLLLGGPAWVQRTLNAKGIQGVLDGIVKTLGDGGITAQQLGKAMGLPPETIKSIKDYSGEIKNVHINVDKAEQSVSSLAKKTEELMTPSKELGKVWTQFTNDLLKLTAPALTSILQGLDSAYKGLTGTGAVKAGDFMSDLGKNLFNVLSLGTAQATNFAGLYGDQKSNQSNNSTINNNTTNIHITPQAVGGGVGSTFMDNSYYLSTQGYLSPKH